MELTVKGPEIVDANCPSGKMFLRSPRWIETLADARPK
jgi:hypothetical protein